MTDKSEFDAAVEHMTWRLGNHDWIRNKLTAVAADLVTVGHERPQLEIAMLAADLLAEQVGRVEAATCLEARARNMRAIAAGRKPEHG